MSVVAARRRYAETLRELGALRSEAVVQAFAEVPREKYLGPGPWRVLEIPGGYRDTPDADPCHVYENLLVELDAERKANNGEPLLHARMLEHLAPLPGDHAVHIGSGTGYYTAILAHLVGETGRVTALEIDAALAARLQKYTADLPCVTALCADGTRLDFDPADCIYVNAGASHPLAHWLDRLRPGGRLVAPLTCSLRGWGGFMMRAELCGAEFSARLVAPLVIFPCSGGHDAAADAVLDEALEQRADQWQDVRWLRRDSHAREDACWLHGEGYCLSTREPPSGVS